MTSTVASMPHIGNMPGFPHSMPINFPGSIPSSLSVTAAPHIPSVRPTSVPPPLQTVQVPVVPVGGGCYNDGMEVVWHGEFSRLFCSFFPPHVWYLSITNSAPQQKWKFYRDSAKVRFCCQDCGNGWTSMKGRVTFWYHLNFATNEGFVQFKLYGQQCKKCNSGKFEYVMWYPEEVSKVMCNVYNKVGQTYYGFMQPPIRIDRRPGRPRNQHNADLCQACRDGECDQARPFKTVYSSLNGGQCAPLNNSLPSSPDASSPPSVTNPMLPVVGPTVPPMLVSAPQQVVSQPVVPYIQDSVITVPVTLTTGSNPILTYSVAKSSPCADINNNTISLPSNSVNGIHPPNDAGSNQNSPITNENSSSENTKLDRDDELVKKMANLHVAVSVPKPVVVDKK